MNDILNIQTKKTKPEVFVTFEGNGQFRFKHNIPSELLVAFLLDAASSLVKQQQKDNSGKNLIWKPTGMTIDAV